MLPLFFLLWDFWFFALLNRYIFFSLLIYIIYIFLSKKELVWSKSDVFALFLLSCENCFLGGKYGIFFVYFFPLFWVFYKINNLFDCPSLSKFLFLIIVIGVDFIFKWGKNIENFWSYSTFEVFLGNVILLIFWVLLGTWGNRFTLK